MQSLAKVIFLLKHVAACEMACVLFHDMLPHLHTIYDIILLNVLTEI